MNMIDPSRLQKKQNIISQINIMKRFKMTHNGFYSSIHRRFIYTQASQSST